MVFALPLQSKSNTFICCPVVSFYISSLLSDMSLDKIPNFSSQKLQLVDKVEI